MTTILEQADDPVVVDSSAYRTFLSIDDLPDPIGRITDQLGSWLREKGWDVPLDVNHLYEDDDAELLVLNHRSSDGAAFRARLIERTNLGVWRTQLTAYSPRSGVAWVALEVVNSEGRFVNVPRIASYLMDSLPTRDGDSLLSSSARIVASNDIGEVLASIRDPRRQGLYLVAGTSRADIDLEVFRKQVDRWAKQVRGLSQVVVLNADATDDMLEAFGPSHGVRPWTIRTFQPDADPDDPDDGLRHKYLSTHRLATDRQQSIVNLLGRVARRHASRRNPPDGFTRIDRSFARIENALLLDAVTSPDEKPTPQTTPVDTPELEAERIETSSAVPVRDDDLVEPSATIDREAATALDLVKIILGIDEITEERLQAIADQAERGRHGAPSLDRIRTQLELREQHIDRLNDEIASIKSDYDDALLDATLAEMMTLT